MSETSNPDERAREKQASRDEDARALASGEKTREQQARENCPFAGVLGRPDFACALGLPAFRRH